MSLLLLHRAATMPASAFRTPTHKLALMCLADSAGDGDRVALPGRDALEAWACVGRSRLYEVLEELIADGLIARLTTGRRGQRARFLVFPQPESTGGDELEGSGTADPSYPQAGSAPAPDPIDGKGPERVRLGSGQGPADTLNPSRVREYGSTGGEGVTYSTSPTDARDAEHVPPDGPSPRPLSPQARETLRVREEREAARAAALEAADRRALLARGADRVLDAAGA